MNGPCTTIRQYRDRDQDRQNRKDAELEAAREADSFSFGPRQKLIDTRLTNVVKHREKCNAEFQDQADSN